MEDTAVTTSTFKFSTQGGSGFLSDGTTTLVSPTITEGSGSSDIKAEIPAKSTGSWVIPAATAITYSMRTASSLVGNLTTDTVPPEMTGVCMVAIDGTGVLIAAKTDVCSVDASSSTRKTFKFKQDGAWSAKYLTVVSPTFEPNTKDAMGRFYFKPNFNSPATVWTGSVFEYTFGTHAFGSEATCQVVKGTTSPGTMFSDSVSVCEISSAKIKVTLAKAISSVDFFVVINRVAIWAGAGEVSGSVSAYTYGGI